MTIIPTADINSQFILDIKAIVQQSRQHAYLSVNAIMISTYWQIGRSTSSCPILTFGNRDFRISPGHISSAPYA